LRVSVLTLFPRLFDAFVDTSLVGKARESGLLEVDVHDLRAYSTDRHRTVDDVAYGGGGGMVLQAPVVLRGLRDLAAGRSAWRVYLSPQGRRLDDALVRELAARGDLILLCGRYEGVDERALELGIDEEVSVGDFVVSGGELPAMILIEALSRQVPGVVGLPDSVAQDSFRDGLLDTPHYTRPAEVEGLQVPAVLASGHHAEIALWREEAALRATAAKRPDLLQRPGLEQRLSPAGRRWLRAWLAARGQTPDGRPDALGDGARDESKS
jgi:tRNA (guanine37-N1)-methyltransferase